MDFRQFIFPFIMAVITNSIMIVIIYFLRKIPAFARLFNVGFMVMLYVFCLLRIFVPIEFPELQIRLRDPVLYAWVMESFFVYHDAAHNTTHPNIFAWIILGIWVVGALILAVRSIVLHSNFKKYLMANGDYATDRERAVFSEVAKEVLNNTANVSLRKTDVIEGTVVVGLIHQTVLIPDEDYSDSELRMMFRHECMHIRNKDLWIKLLVQIYCCIFWWNPFAYLLKSDLDLTLEMKCDLSTTKGFSDAQVLTYVETLKNRCVTNKNKKTPFIVSSELVDGKKKDQLIQRIRKLLSLSPSKAKQITVHVLTLVLFLSIFAASYLFIWQPYYEEEFEIEHYELKEDGIIVDNSNAYLVKDGDGNYLFYYSDYPPEPIPKEEVEQGMYDDYPIYEK